jgi:hypothetical protein
MCVLLAVAGAMALPAGAAGKGKVHLFLWSVKATGVSLTVDFHGDPATGCADHGLCDTAGTLHYRLANGNAILFAFGSGNVLSGSGSAIRAARTTASVTTAGATTPCKDSVRSPAALLGLDSHSTFYFGRSPLTEGTGIDLGEIFATHCAGPVMADVARGLPRRQFPKHYAHRKRITLDLTGAMPWAGESFAGTVTATGRLVLTRVRCSSGGCAGLASSSGR